MSFHESAIARAVAVLAREFPNYGKAIDGWASALDVLAAGRELSGHLWEFAHALGTVHPDWEEGARTRAVERAISEVARSTDAEGRRSLLALSAQALWCATVLRYRAKV